MGSSPRMRGTQLGTFFRHFEFGIIPAYAGNTDSVRTCLIPFGDHPRVCGEHLPDTLTTSKPEGSSPRMRGTPFRITEIDRQIGIIPAYAGNTQCLPSPLLASRDHPRVCGEHPIFDHWPARVTGSSPRMRGTLGRADQQYPHAGIIPAYAGNTVSKNWTDKDYGDHPRVCGEHPFNASLTSFSRGSSPRMRGTPAFWRADNASFGIIPAYAGNTKDGE